MLLYKNTSLTFLITWQLPIKPMKHSQLCIAPVASASLLMFLSYKHSALSTSRMDREMILFAWAQPNLLLQQRHLLAHLLPLLPQPAVLLQRVFVVVVLRLVLRFVDLGLANTSVDRTESTLIVTYGQCCWDYSIKAMQRLITAWWSSHMTSLTALFHTQSMTNHFS